MIADRLVTLIDQGTEELERALEAARVRFVEDNDAHPDEVLLLDLYAALTGEDPLAWKPCPVCGAEGPDQSCVENGELTDDHDERGAA